MKKEKTHILYVKGESEFGKVSQSAFRAFVFFASSGDR